MNRMARIGVTAAFTAIVCAGVGIGIAASGDVQLAAAPGGSGGPAVVTPLASARRIPEWLVRPVAGARLQSAVQPALAALPPSRCVVVSDGHDEIVSDHPTDELAPASNLKLLVATAAIETFGAQNKLATDVLTTSPPDGTGAVTGDLVLRGAGDPLLETATYGRTQKYGAAPHTALEALADHVVAAGVKHITGAVLGDESRYDDQRNVDSWPARIVSQNQAGPLSALSVNDARAYPAIAEATGSVRPAPDPAAYAASALTELLRARGVVIDGEARSATTPAGATVLLSEPSLAIADIVGEMLTYSDNNTAELLLKELGAQKAGDGSTAAGLPVERTALGSAGIDLAGATVMDGSGLDPTNRVSCRLLTKLLSHDGARGPLSSGLAQAGKPGTMRDRFRGSPVAGDVRAKTGTLRGVTALSGWIHTQKNSDLAFSILLDLDGRDVGDADLVRTQRVVEALASYPDAPPVASVEPAAART